MSDGIRVIISYFCSYSWRFAPVHRRLYGGALVLSALTLSIAMASTPLIDQRASAQTATSAISQEFESDQRDISIGALVSLDKEATNKVSLASSDNADDLVGIAADTALVEIGGTASNPNTPIKLQVVTTGVIDTLVSDINGSVKVGDRITASPVRGVGMRLTGNAQIIGVAQGNFSSSSASSAQTTTREITGNDGSKMSIKIGRLPVRVNIGYYSGNPTDNAGNPDTPLLQRLANAIAGRQTSTVRMVISFSLLVMGFIVMVVLLRTAVASSLTSIGRNPLSADAIHKNFYAVAFIALGILLVALATSYLALVI